MANLIVFPLQMFTLFPLWLILRSLFYGVLWFWPVDLGVDFILFIPWIYCVSFIYGFLSFICAGKS